MKNSSDTIGNRALDLPACNAVPQPAAPPGAPLYKPKHHEFLDAVGYAAILTTVIQLLLM